jgi:hypothetical protein
MENKKTRVFPDFAEELTKLDSRITVKENPNRPGLANILLDGVDICPIPQYEIFDEIDPGYKITFHNGWTAIHKSRKEALSQVESTLQLIKTQDGADRFFGRGDFA